jgi:hypothetical protein
MFHANMSKKTIRCFIYGFRQGHHRGGAWKNQEAQRAGQFVPNEPMRAAAQPTRIITVVRQGYDSAEPSIADDPQGWPKWPKRANRYPFGPSIRKSAPHGYPVVTGCDGNPNLAQTLLASLCA